MPIDESVEPTAAGVLSLAVRRPGHALMTGLIDELDRGGHGASVPPDLQSWHTGAVGEVLVGQELARLPAEWRVLHSLPVGQVADIDHLVIGPPGVFVLNTKHHAGKVIGVGTHLVWINGTKTAGYQRHLGDRAVKVHHALHGDGVPELVVQPLLVFVGAQQLRRNGEQTVASVRMAEVVAYLEGQPSRLTAEQVDHLHDLAARPATWGRRASVLHEPDPTARFLRLALATPVLTRGAMPPRRPAAAAPVLSHPLLKRRRTGLRRLGLRLLAVVLALAAAPVIALLTYGLFVALLRALIER